MVGASASSIEGALLVVLVVTSSLSLTLVGTELAGSHSIGTSEGMDRSLNLGVLGAFGDANYPVTFNETGLPSGTNWSVALYGTNNSSRTSTVEFFEPNGWYPYTINSVPGFVVAPSSGWVHVRNNARAVNVTFNETFNATFTETGLPSGSTWYVNGTAWGSLSATVAGTLGTSVFVNLTNGTYSFTVAGANKTWAPAYTSPFVVNGGPVAVPVTFTEVTYAVTFTESGLPSGTTWYLNLTDGQSNSSTGTTISFLEPNGTYNYTVATVDKAYAPVVASGSFGVSGASVGESVTFSPTTYPVTFTEMGLPNGTTWYVNGTAWGSLSATVAGTLGTSVSANLTNGTYSFTVASANKTWAPAYTSPFVVNGGPVAVSVTFTEVTYAVTFTESGLPSGTTWYVNLTDGQSNSSTGSMIGFSEPNGSYSYTVATVDKEYASSGGVFMVDGATVLRTVTFSLVTHAITFTETGLPSGTTWYVNLTDGQSNSSTGTTISFLEPNGTYNYTVATVDKAYAPVVASGSFGVSGASVGESVTFSPTTYPVTFTEMGLPNGTTWYVNGTAWGSLSATVVGTFGTSVSANLANGTYPFTVASANKTWAPAYTSPFVVNGAPVPVPVTFTEVTYAVTFTETGLPSGTHWSVTLNGTQHTSTTNIITFTESNGTYPYAIAGISGWHQTTLPYTGEVKVKGAAVTEPTLVFTQVTYSVTFTESGLPSGTEWWVNLTGGQTFSSTTDSLSFAEPNGTYDYTVATADKEYASVVASDSFGVSGASVSESVTFNLATYTVTFTETGLPSGTTWYVNGTAWGTLSATVAGTLGTAVSANLANGTYSFTVTSSNKTWAPAYTSPFVVKGGPVAVSVTFTEVTYAVTFTESGLPSGTTWYVNLTDGQSNSSTGSMIGFSEPNGSYSYTVATADKEYASVVASGSFGVSGASVGEAVTFSPTTYPVTFTEMGLPNGTTWYVNGTAWGSLSATVAGTLGTSVSANLANGTYSFTVASANKTWAPAYMSPFVVNGTPVPVPVTFTEVTYAVTFTENGLPLDTLWNVTIGSVTRNSTTSTIILFEPNGSYSYTVATADKEDASAGGSFRVNGTVVSATVTFTVVKYAITFTETGLPSGTTWYVNITGGQSHSSTGNTIRFLEPNGTYVYTVGGVPDWTSPMETGTVTVNGAAVSVPTITYTSTRSESPVIGWWVWAIDGVVIIAVVATAVVVVLSRRKPPATPLGSSSTMPGSGGSETESPSRTQSE
jgi:hypothetical protein